MATIAKLAVEISANSTKLRAGLSKASAQIKAFAKKAAKTFAKIGAAVGVGVAAGVAGLIVLVNKYAAEIDSLAKFSTKFGLTVGVLQKLQYQAELTGVSISTMNMSIQKMVRNISEASLGIGTAKEELKELGLSAAYLNSLKPDQQFLAIADAMKKVGNQNDKVRMSIAIFGRSGTDILNTMAGDLRGMSDEFDSLDMSVSQSGAKMVEAYNDSKHKMETIFSGFGLKLTEQLAGPLKMVTDLIADVIIEFGGMEAAVNKLVLSMVTGFRGIVDVINSMIQGINEFTLMSKRAELKGAEHRGAIEGTASAVSGGFIGDPTGNQANISRIKKEIEGLEKPIKSLSKIDEFIKKMQEKVKYNQGFVGGVEVVATTAQKASNSLKKVASDTETLSSSSKKAAENNTKLAEAANKAAAALAPEAKKVSSETVIKKSSSFSKIGGLSSGLSGVSMGGKSAEAASQSGSNAIKKNTQSMGSVNINMTTDAGKISGELFGEPSFISSLKSFSDKNANQSAAMAAI